MGEKTLTVEIICWVDVEFAIFTTVLFCGGHCIFQGELPGDEESLKEIIGNIFVELDEESIAELPTGPDEAFVKTMYSRVIETDITIN